MKTYNNSTINRHIYEGGDYDEHDDGSVTLHRPVTVSHCACGYPKDRREQTCGYCVDGVLPEHFKMGR
jgi:hypothetical protein